MDITHQFDHYVQLHKKNGVGSFFKPHIIPPSPFYHHCLSLVCFLFFFFFIFVFAFQNKIEGEDRGSEISDS